MGGANKGDRQTEREGRKGKGEGEGDTHTHRQTDRQTDRHRHRHRHSHSPCVSVGARAVDGGRASGVDKGCKQSVPARLCGTPSKHKLALQLPKACWLSMPHVVCVCVCVCVLVLCVGFPFWFWLQGDRWSMIAEYVQTHAHTTWRRSTKVPLCMCMCVCVCVCVCPKLKLCVSCWSLPSTSIFHPHLFNTPQSTDHCLRFRAVQDVIARVNAMKNVRQELSKKQQGSSDFAKFEQVRGVVAPVCAPARQRNSFGACSVLHPCIPPLSLTSSLSSLCLGSRPVNALLPPCDRARRRTRRVWRR